MAYTNVKIGVPWFSHEHMTEWLWKNTSWLKRDIDTIVTNMPERMANRDFVNFAFDYQEYDDNTIDPLLEVETPDYPDYLQEYVWETMTIRFIRNYFA